MDLLSIIPSILGLVNQFAGSWEEKQKEAFQLALTQLVQGYQIQLEQIKVNEAQASNSNPFISGPRPFIMWVCGIAFAWQSIIFPISCWIATLAHHPELVQQLQQLHFDPNLNYVLASLLGIGHVARTAEKITNTQNNH